MDNLVRKFPDLVDFKTKGQIFSIQNDPITMKQWVHERDYYTRIQIETKLFGSRHYIFLLECKTIKLQVSNVVELSVMVCVSALVERKLYFMLAGQHAKLNTAYDF